MCVEKLQKTEKTISFPCHQRVEGPLFAVPLVLKSRVIHRRFNLAIHQVHIDFLSCRLVRINFAQRLTVAMTDVPKSALLVRIYIGCLALISFAEATLTFLRLIERCTGLEEYLAAANCVLNFGSIPLLLRALLTPVPWEGSPPTAERSGRTFISSIPDESEDFPRSVQG